MTTIFFILLGSLAAIGVAAAVVATVRDGYRRAPITRPLREYQRDDHYRA